MTTGATRTIASMANAEGTPEPVRPFAGDAGTGNSTPAGKGTPWGNASARVELVVDAAERASLRLTPPELASTPARFQRADSTSAFRPRDSALFSSTELLEAEARLLERSRTMTAPTLPLAVIQRVTGVPDREGRILGPDQADALTKIAVSGRMLDLLVGPAGTGKTTAMNALRQAWEQQHGKGSVVGLAPSVVAAEILAETLASREWDQPRFKTRAKVT